MWETDIVANEKRIEKATGERPLCFFKSRGSTFITKVWHQGPGIKKIEPYDFMLSTDVAGIIRDGKERETKRLV